MKRVIAAIESEGKRVAAHPLFSRLEKEPIERLVPVLGYNIGFWIMGFQDVLKIVDDAVQSPELKVYSKHHRDEDTGHHVWFVNDLAKLGYGAGSRVFSFFEPRNLTTRMVAYKIFSEIFNLTDDRLRVAFLITLESSGHVFFGRMNDYVSRRGLGKDLKFFGQHHIDVETEHTVFSDDSEARIHALELEDDLAREGVAMARRVHELFLGLADEILRQLDDDAWVSELQASRTGVSTWKIPPVDMSFVARS